MDNKEEAPLHIVVFPWLAFGHMLPLLQLSKTLAKKGHLVSFLATTRNISRLPPIPASISGRINLIPFHLPSVAGLPSGAEATSDLSPNKVQYLKMALDGLRDPFAAFLRKSSPKPDWIILDFATYWVPPIAAENFIPCALFTVWNASFLAFFGPPDELSLEKGSRKTPEDFTVPPPWIPFPSKLIYSINGAQVLINDVYRNNASGVPDIYRFVSTLRACKVVAPRACAEVEPECLALLQDLYAKAVVPVGLLSPPAPEKRVGSSNSSIEICRWLDTQTHSSVIYIAFGSEATLSVELLHELAFGLELSNVPFVWALRKPGGIPEGAEVLPEGFMERTRERGLVSMGWVPQLDVLAHPAVGGFLTHSGWSSIIEAMRHGRPVVLLPIFADQYINSRMVEQGGFGVELKRKGEDGFFDREAVAEAVRLAVVEDEGKEVRFRAEQMKKVFANDERQEEYVDEFVRFMRNNRGL